MNIFISHNSADKKLASELVNLIHVGIGIKKDKIFCSSCDGIGVPIGANFQIYIKDKLKDSGLVLALITQNYYQSTFSMYELGAAWAQSTLTIPILVDIENSDLRDILSNIQAVNAKEVKDLNSLKDQLCTKFHPKSDTNTWEKQRDSFINIINTIKMPPPRSIPQLYQKKYKLVAFDLDGTLLQGKNFSYSWKTIWQYLGYDDALRQNLWDKYENNPSSYSYEQWCKDCVSYFMKKGLNRLHIKEIIRNNKIRQAPTLAYTINVLKRHGIITAVISGSIDTFYELGISTRVQNLIDYVYINKFIYDHEQRLIGIKIENGIGSDYENKLKTLEMICSRINCTVDEAVFVGEGFNDIYIGESPCLSIAYPYRYAHPGYNSVANVKIPERSINAILPYILTGK